MKLGLKISTRNKGKANTQGENERGWRSRLKHSRLVKFLPFLLLALLIWVQQTLQNSFTRSVYIPLATDSISSSLGVAGRMPEHLRVEVKDKGFEHLAYSFEGFAPLQLHELENSAAGLYIGMGEKELTMVLKSQLSETAQILSIYPRELKIAVHQRVSKRVPITLEGRPKTPSGYMISSVRFRPDSLTIYGEQELIARTQSISTLPWQDSLVRSNIDRMVSLQLPKGLHSDQRQVNLSIQLEELTEQSYTLPIEIAHEPEGSKVIPLPSTATVLLTLPRSRFNTSLEDSIQVIADYSKRDAERGEMPVRIGRKPAWVIKAKLSPDLIQYIKTQEHD